MTSPAERRYRDVLRLLPAGYRANWEEDMVTAYLQSSPTDRPGLSERLSVVWLALRLRLNGSHASPRAMVGYRTVHAVALLVLLYQAVAATTSVVNGVLFVVQVSLDRPLFFDASYAWISLSSVFWIPAFACFVWNRFVAARVLVLLGSASAIGITLAMQMAANDPSRIVVIEPSPITVTDVSRWAWLALSVVAVFVTPSGARASRRLWVGAYLVGSAFTVAVVLGASFAVRDGSLLYYYPWLWFAADISVLASTGLAVAMLVVLGTSRSPHWLVALALTACGLGGVQLLSAHLRSWSPGPPAVSGPSDTLDVVLLALALVCAAVGLLRWRRVPGR